MIALTDKQERFVAEYLIDQNASAAARRAGYSPRSASSVATELMRTPHVRERVEQALRDMLAEIKCTAMALIRERMRAAFFRARRLFKGNELRAFDELDDETYDALFISYEVRESGPIIRVRQPNREQALRALERVHERLDRLQDARCAKAVGAVPAHAGEADPATSVPDAPFGGALDLEHIAAAPPAAATEPAAPSDAPADDPAMRLTPRFDLPTAAPLLDEKTQVFTGSPPCVPAADLARPKLSPFGAVIAAWRARKRRETPDANLGGRHDPNSPWAGVRPPTAPSEPRAALI
jgi:hypothetical protein